MLLIRRVFQRLMLRLRRQRLVLRSLRKRAELTLQVPPQNTAGVLLFSVVRNEHHRLAEFLEHYRSLGVSQFFFVDNGSTDATNAFLRQQPDVALWRTTASYRRSRYGVDWSDALKRQYGCGRWCLTVDADELLVYPNCETRSLHALTSWLEERGRCSFSTLLLDMYSTETSTGPSDCEGGLLKQMPWFDAGTYRAQRDPVYGHDWIQGGPRERLFFAARPERAPALNKLPLVKWQRGYAYVSSTHHILPRGLNRRRALVPTGILLHTKLTPDFAAQAIKEVQRKEHFDGATEYKAYLHRKMEAQRLHHEGSVRLGGWHQLEALGLMSRGVWV